MEVKYGTIVADPPWSYGERTAPWRSTSEQTYPLMSLGEIAALPVPELATPDAHLYLWAVLPLMREAFFVLEGWGFLRETVLTWCKPGPGLGGGFRGNTEHLIVGRRGSPPWINPTCELCGGRVRGANKCACVTPAWRHKGQPITRTVKPFRTTADGTWYVAPRGEHSQKPELFLDLAERMSYGPYLEMFARRNRLGWDTWGNESFQHVEIAA
jgi:N6-adenosine-specific RNA methylase IME4